jgi:hypothetical protein
MDHQPSVRLEDLGQPTQEFEAALFGEVVEDDRRPDAERRPEAERRPDADRGPEVDQTPDRRPEADRGPEAAQTSEADRTRDTARFDDPFTSLWEFALLPIRMTMAATTEAPRMLTSGDDGTRRSARICPLCAALVAAEGEARHLEVHRAEGQRP